MIQQIFDSDSTSTERSSDGLPAALLIAIKTALEKDQTSGLELLATLDSTLTDKVSFDPLLYVNLSSFYVDPTTRRTRDP
jgi:mediator of RNA polymerase II transcription subunit 12